MTRPFLFFVALTIILGGSIGGAFAGGVALGKTQNEESVTTGLAATGGQGSRLGQAGLGLPQQDQLRQGIQPGDSTRQDLAQLGERIRSGEVGQEDLQGLRERFRSGEVGQEDLQGLRERFRSGEVGQEDLQGLRERFRSGEVGQEDLQGLRERFRSGQVGQENFGQALRQRPEASPGGTGSRGFPGRTGAIEQVEGNILTLSTEEGTVRASIGADTTIRRFLEATLADLAQGMRITLIGLPREDGIVEATSIIMVPDGQEGFFGGGFPPRDRRQRGDISGGAGRFPGGN